MRKLHKNVNLAVTTGFCIYIAISILLFPIRWVAAWGVATMAHELFHYCAISAFKIPIHSIVFDANGIQLSTAPMKDSEAVLCALAGPVGGLTLLLFAKWMPCVAICSLIQSAYNLLPIYPLDGGRAVRGILHNILPEQYGYWAYRCIEIIVLFLVCLLCLYAFFALKLGVLPLVAMSILMVKRFPCKQGA